MGACSCIQVPPVVVRNVPTISNIVIGYVNIPNRGVLGAWDFLVHVDTTQQMCDLIGIGCRLSDADIPVNGAVAVHPVIGLAGIPAVHMRCFSLSPGVIGGTLGCADHGRAVAIELRNVSDILLEIGKSKMLGFGLGR